MTVVTILGWAAVVFALGAAGLATWAWTAPD